MKTNSIKRLVFAGLSVTGVLCLLSIRPSIDSVDLFCQMDYDTFRTTTITDHSGGGTLATNPMNEHSGSGGLVSLTQNETAAAGVSGFIIDHQGGGTLVPNPMNEHQGEG